MIGELKRLIKQSLGYTGKHDRGLIAIDLLGYDRLKVLDLGGGNGNDTIRFGAGSTNVTVNADQINHCKQNSIPVIGQNIEELKINEKFDAVYCSHMFEHVYTPYKFFQSLRSIPGVDIYFIIVPIFSDNKLFEKK